MFKAFKDAIGLLDEYDYSLEELYQNWWSGIPNGLMHPSVIDSLHEPIKSLRLFVNGRVEIHSIGQRAIVVNPGEYIERNGDRCDLIRKASWSDTWWNWLQTSSPSIFPADNMLRIYIPSPDTKSHEIADQIFSKSENVSFPLTLKFRRQDGVFKDSMVVWIYQSYLSEFLEIQESIFDTVQFLIEPPPLTFHRSGIGYAEHPRSGNSLGWSYCELIWELHKTGRIDALEGQLRERGFCADTPWLLDENSNMRSWISLL